MLRLKIIGEEPIKAISDRKIGGTGILFGSENQYDAYKEWFDETTVVGVENGDRRPFLMEHGKSDTFGLEILGQAVYEKSGDGWEYEVQLPDSELGEKAYGELKNKRYKSSSGSSWHTTRQSYIKGTYKFDTWLIVEQSATQRPADSQNPPISIKSLLEEGLQPSELIERFYKMFEDKFEKDSDTLKSIETILREKFSLDTTEPIVKGVELSTETLDEISELTTPLNKIQI